MKEKEKQIRIKGKRKEIEAKNTQYQERPNTSKVLKRRGKKRRKCACSVRSVMLISIYFIRRSRPVIAEMMHAGR